MLTKKAIELRKTRGEKKKNIHRSSIYNKHVVYSSWHHATNEERRACYFLIFPLFVCGVFFSSLSWRNFIFQITWMAGSWRVQIQNRQTFCDCFSCYFFCSWLLSVILLLFPVTILHIRFRVTFHPELELQYIRCILIWSLSIASRLNVLMAFIILLVKIGIDDFESISNTSRCSLKSIFTSQWFELRMKNKTEA